MKRIVSLLLTLVMLVGMLPQGVMAAEPACNHEHDEACLTAQCTHVHDEACGYVQEAPDSDVPDATGVPVQEEELNSDVPDATSAPAQEEEAPDAAVMTISDGGIGSGTPDGTPPVLHSVTLSKTAVTAPDTVEITVEASDDVSGVRYAEISFKCDATGKWLHAFLEPEEDGKLYGTLAIDQYVEPGSFYIDDILLEDTAGNRIHYWSTTETGVEQLPEEIRALSLEVVESEKPDGTPPVLHSVTLSKNVVTAPSTVEITIAASDDVSGVRYAEISFTCDATGKWLHAFLEPEEDGKLCGTLTIDQYVEPGSFYIDDILLEDTARNRIHYWSTTETGVEQLPEEIRALSLEVVESEKPDGTPPVLHSVTLSKNVVTAPSTVEITIAASDDVSGVRYAEISFTCDATGKWLHAFLEPEEDGKLYGTLAIDQYVEPGSFYIDDILLEDTARNRIHYWSTTETGVEQLPEEIRNLKINVLGSGKPDSTPPVLHNLELLQTTVTVPGSISFSWTASDDISGISSIGLSFVHTESGEYLLNDEAPEIGELSGTFYGTITPDEYTMPGEYVLEHIGISDIAGNSWWCSDRPNADQAIPDAYKDLKITVVNNNEIDRTPPELKNITLLGTAMSAPGEIGIVVDAVDEGSGLAYIGISFFCEENGEGVGASDLVLGYNPETGLYHGAITADAYDFPGTYVLSHVLLEDNAENYVEYVVDPVASGYGTAIPDELRSLSFEITDSVSPDNIAPTINGVTLSSPIVMAPGTVTVYFDISDENSGIGLVKGDFYCEETKKYYDFGKFHYGDENEEYYATIEVSQYEPSGVFVLDGLVVQDRADNGFMYVRNSTSNDPAIATLLDHVQFTVINRGADVTTSVSKDTFVEEIIKADSDAYIAADYSGDATMPKEAFEAIAGTDKTIDLISEGITWRFEGSDITEEIKDIDLKVDIQKVEDDSSASGDAIESELNGNPGVVMKFPENGTLPGKATIQVKVDYAMREYLGSDTGLTVYYYNNQTGQLELIASGLKVINDTYVEFPITHCSYYVLTNPNGSNSGTTHNGVAVDKTNFPDDNFRGWILEQGYGKDGVLTEDELSAVTMMDVTNQEILDLTGIEYFSALEHLDCGNIQKDKFDKTGFNQISTLDLSGNPALRILYCGDNQLTHLDVSKNTKLEYLYCYANQLSILDLQNNIALKTLNCNNNNLAKLDVSHNTELDSLGCDANQLTQLDVGKNTRLTYLGCGSNQLTVLDISKNTALQVLHCGNNQLTALDVSLHPELEFLTCYYNQLTKLDVGNNPLLTNLECQSNQLIQLDVSKNTALIELHCDSNQLTSLDVRNLTALETINCYNNQLTALDVSKNTALRYLYCGSNQITSLDVQNLAALESLYCSNNPLTALDISKNTLLTLLSCGSNLLTALDVSKNTALIELSCSFNQITSLDLQNNTQLRYLNCNDNALTALEVQHLEALETLYCDLNQLTALDISKNTALRVLYCSSNQITSLDLQHLEALEYLSCDNNQLTALDVSKNTALIELSCSSNQITSLDLQHLEALQYLYCHSNQLTSLDLSNNPQCSSVYATGNYRQIQLDDNREFDLSTLAGFDVSRASNWIGGTVNGKILTATDKTITYSYRISDEVSETFTLLVENPVVGGQCGDNLKWILESGTLTISGTGTMYNFTSGSQPWDAYKQEIESVVIESGATSIGSFAFGWYSGLTSIAIPNSVTSIGDSALVGCSGLTSITIPDSVTSIGESAFAVCKNLTGIKIPNRVTTIGTGVFSQCESLTSVVIGKGITSITERMFAYCRNLNGVVIPDGVTSIGDNAFVACESLTNIRIPNSVTSIGASAFDACSALTSVSIGNGVTSIGNDAFNGCAIPGIMIPNSVTSIGNGAFYECDNLTGIRIPASVTSIGDYVFTCCSNLSEITFEGSAPAFNLLAFSGITATCYYPADDSTWNDAIKSTYGGNITWVAQSSDPSATEPPTVPPTTAPSPTIPPATAPTAIGTCGENVNWEYNPSTKKLTISGTGAMYDYDVDTIPWYLYQKSIAEVVIHPGVTSIGDYAFYLCEGITSLTIGSGVTGIGNSSFSNCKSLTSVTIPDGVTTIDAAAFSWCDSLTSVTIGKGISSIGAEVFYGCTNLNKITFRGGAPAFDPMALSGITAKCYYPAGNSTWNDAVKSTYGGNITWVAVAPSGSCGKAVTWEYESGTLTISGSGMMDDYGTGLQPWDAYKEDINSIVIESGVTGIGDYAFNGCENLTSVIISNSVTSIGCKSFAYCESLTGITIPDSVTTIKAAAFKGCTGLNEITFKGDAPTIENETFWDVTATCYYPAGNSTWTETIKSTYDGNITWVAYDASNGKCGENVFWSYDKTSQKLTISGTGAMCDFSSGSQPWDMYRQEIRSIVIESGVTSIGDHAFYWYFSPNSITISDSVTRIGDYALSGCSGIISITIPNSVTSIGVSAFATCRNLTGIVIPDSVTSLGMGAFSECDSLASVTIGKGITSISEMAFWNCKSLTSIVIPDWVTTIEDSAFLGCDYLVSATIGDGVTSIGNRAFEYCCSLTSVKIGNSVTSIGEWAFDYCYNLTSIVIPDSVISIGDYAFCVCSELEDITIGNNVTSIGRYAFNGCAMTNITIPASVTSIGDYAFSYCDNLNGITFEGSAPAFDSLAFSGVTATCYYPADDSTWNDAIKSTYGGNITWVAYECGENAHKEVVKPAVAPTCTETGLTEGKYCSACGKTIVAQETVPAKGHTERIISAVAATCTTDGLTEGKYCSVCNFVTVWQVEVAATGHTEVTDKAVAPTCTEIGLTEGSHCSACQTVLKAQQTIAATGHAEVTDAAVAPTCTATGLTEGTHCTKCNETVVAQQTVPAKGHTEYTIAAVAATCTTDGLTEGKYCSVCNLVTVLQTEVAATGHNEVTDAAVEPTCTATGLTEGKHCSKCNEVIVAQNVVAAKGHTDANADYSCDVCKENLCENHAEETIPAQVPTCTETGLTEGKRCTICGEVTVAQTVVAAKGHTEIAIAAVAPTCAETGLSEGKKCTTCDAITVQQSVVAAKGHTETAIEAVAPTCTETGLSEGRKCTVCDVVTVQQSAVAATGHTEVTDAAVEPTCTETGLTEGKHCSVCNTVLTAQEVVEATGIHIYVDSVCQHCGAEEPAQEPEILELTGATMTLGNNLAINFVVDTSKLTGDGHYAKITKEYGNGRGTSVITVAQEKWKVYSEDLYYIPFDGVAAKEMTDTITVVIYNSEGVAVTDEWHDSVRDYAMRALTKEEAKASPDREKLALYVDMMLYGAAAQRYFGNYHGSDLADSLLSSAQRAYATTNVAMTNQQEKGEGYAGTTLTLESRILLNFVYHNSALEGVAYAAAVYKDHYGTPIFTTIPAADFKAYSDTMTYIPVSGMAVADCGQLVTLILYDENDNAVSISSDSVESYISRIANANELYSKIIRFAYSAYMSFH